MPAKNLHKHTLFLYEGDYARLQAYYPEVGGAVVVRKLVRKHLEALDEKSKSNDNEAEIEKLYQE